MTDAEYQRAAKLAADKRDRSSIEIPVYHPNNDARDFADSDGDTADKHLALKRKKSESSDDIPRAENAYNSGNKIRGA